MTTIPAAMLQAGTARRFRKPTGVLMVNVSFAGQTATHSRQLVHSAERIWMSLSTGSAAGQALAHLAQSMQVCGLRVIRNGLSHEASPRKAP